MSGRRRRGLLRLALLVVLVGWLVVLAVRGVVGGSSSGSSATDTGPASRGPVRLKASTSPLRLPQPLHGATAAPAGDGVLVIGGADRNDVSTDGVLLLDPAHRKIRRDGALVQPLHDAAAATVAGRTVVFGGGAATTFDTIQQLVPGSVASAVGRLPAPASDLSAVSTGSVAYVAGGYDGRTPLASVLQQGDRGGVARVGNLPTAVRYTALATARGRIYAFGGELADGTDTDRIQQYDPATHRASVIGHLAQPVSHASAIVLNDTIYLLGGRRSGAASDQILRFDPSGGTTARVGRLPFPLFDAAGATAAGVGYLIGGIGSAGTSVDRIIAVRQ
jgi:hypothetical protein